MKLLVALLLTVLACASQGQSLDNYPDRKAVVLNVCPYVELSNFGFQNRYADRSNRFEQSMTWRNIGSQPLVAFEIIILKYDAFDQRVIGSRWTVTGKNSADWRPLAPGDSGNDGTIGYGSEEVFTGIAYVRLARLADGTVWKVNDAQLLSELKKVAPGIREYGKLEADPKPQPRN